MTSVTKLNNNIVRNYKMSTQLKENNLEFISLYTKNGNQVTMTSDEMIELEHIIKKVIDSEIFVEKNLRGIQDIESVKQYFLGDLSQNYFETFLNSFYKTVFKENLILFKEFITDCVQVTYKYKFGFELDENNGMYITTDKKIEHTNEDVIEYSNGDTESTYSRLMNDYDFDMESPNGDELSVYITNVMTYLDSKEVSFKDNSKEVS